MQRIKIVSTLVSMLTGSTGKSIVTTAKGRGGKDLDGELYGQANVYSRPVKDDFAVVSDIGQNRVITGVHDYNFQEEIEAGEIIIYSRSDSKTIKSKIYNKNTGEIVINNDKTNITIKETGQILIENENLTFDMKDDGELLLDNGNSKINLKSDGETLIENSSAKVKLETTGNIVLNDGAISAVSFTALKTGFEQLKADFNAFIGHVHNIQVTPGLSPIPPASSPPSTATIDGAESATVKLP